MKRAVTAAIALVALLTTACSRQPSPPQHVSPRPPPPADRSRSEVLVGSLSPGRLPTTAKRHNGPPVERGLFLERTPYGPWIGGTKIIVPVSEVELRDPEDALEAFCVRGVGEHDSALHGGLPHFAMPLGDRDTVVRAERVAIGGSGSASFHAMNTWVPSGARLPNVEKLEETTTPLSRIASMNGIDVFAFVEEPGTPGAPRAVQVVVRRAPIHTGRAHFAAFFVTGAEGSSAATTCGHVRASLPLRRGDGGAVEIDVAVEQADGIRPMHIEVSSLWLASEAEATVRTRMRWLGPVREELSVGDFRPGMAKR